MKYLIGTGYHAKPNDAADREKFFKLWWENTMRFAKPERVVVLASGGNSIPYAPGQWIPLAGDLGHVSDLVSGAKPFAFCGWSISICLLALAAYFDECDFIFKEQDALAFGPWIERIYYELGDRNVLFGSAKCMPAVQSIFFVRHSFIPRFVELYLGTGDERKSDNLGEFKFARLEREHPQDFGRFSFGVDRDRPIPYDSKVFYAQQLSQQELEELRQRELI
jgi:hypothetical protein